jgi:hypothetical protein
METAAFRHQHSENRFDNFLIAKGQQFVGIRAVSAQAVRLKRAVIAQYWPKLPSQFFLRLSI